MDWTAFQKIDTLVVLMVGRNLAILLKLLQKAGRPPDTPVSPRLGHSETTLSACKSKACTCWFMLSTPETHPGRACVSA